MTRSPPRSSSTRVSTKVSKKSSKKSSRSPVKIRIKKTKTEKGLSDLPDEVLLKILGYLEPSILHRSVALVSSRMCRLTRDASFHRTAIFKSGKTLSAKVIKYLRQYGPDLRELHLIQFHGIQGIVKAATRFAGQLKKLKVCTSSLSRPLKALEVLTDQCVLPNLEELDIHVQIKGQTAIIMSHMFEDHEIMKALCTSRGSIIKNIDWNASYFSESSDIPLACIDSCTSLDTLRICGYMRPMSNHFFGKLSTLTNLKHIMIGQCRLENTDLLRFFREVNWATVKTLQLKNLKDLDDRAFESLLKAAPNLEALRLHGSIEVTSNLSFRHEKIKYLWIQKITPFRSDELLRIIQVFPKLRFIALRQRDHTELMSNEVLDQVVASTPMPIILRYNRTLFGAGHDFYTNINVQPKAYAFLGYNSVCDRCHK